MTGGGPRQGKKDKFAFMNNIINSNCHHCDGKKSKASKVKD